MPSIAVTTARFHGVEISPRRATAWMMTWRCVCLVREGASGQGDMARGMQYRQTHTLRHGEVHHFEYHANMVSHGSLPTVVGLAIAAYGILFLIAFCRLARIARCRCRRWTKRQVLHFLMLCFAGMRITELMYWVSVTTKVTVLRVTINRIAISCFFSLYSVVVVQWCVLAGCFDSRDAMDRDGHIRHWIVFLCVCVSGQG